MRISLIFQRFWASGTCHVHLVIVSESMTSLVIQYCRCFWPLLIITFQIVQLTGRTARICSRPKARMCVFQVAFVRSSYCGASIRLDHCRNLAAWKNWLESIHLRYPRSVTWLGFQRCCPAQLLAVWVIRHRLVLSQVMGNACEFIKQSSTLAPY